MKVGKSTAKSMLSTDTKIETPHNYMYYASVAVTRCGRLSAVSVVEMARMQQCMSENL